MTTNELISFPFLASLDKASASAGNHEAGMMAERIPLEKAMMQIGGFR